MFVSLSDEQRRFVQTVRDLAQREFRPRALKYMDGSFPWENMKALVGLGVLGMAVPEAYGGLGLGAQHLREASEAIQQLLG